MYLLPSSGQCKITLCFSRVVSMVQRVVLQQKLITEILFISNKTLDFMGFIHFLNNNKTHIWRPVTAPVLLQSWSHGVSSRPVPVHPRQEVHWVEPGVWRSVSLSGPLGWSGMFQADGGLRSPVWRQEPLHPSQLPLRRGEGLLGRQWRSRLWYALNREISVYSLDERCNLDDTGLILD